MFWPQGEEIGLSVRPRHIQNVHEEHVSLAQRRNVQHRSSASNSAHQRSANRTRRHVPQPLAENSRRSPESRLNQQPCARSACRVQRSSPGASYSSSCSTSHNLQHTRTCTSRSRTTAQSPPAPATCSCHRRHLHPAPLRRPRHMLPRSSPEAVCTGWATAATSATSADV